MPSVMAITETTVLYVHERVGGPWGGGRLLGVNECKKFLITTQDTCVTVLESSSSRPRHLDPLDTPFFDHHP